MLCADHGPCVSGAHNSIVTARAGKDIGKNSDLVCIYILFLPVHPFECWAPSTVSLNTQSLAWSAGCLLSGQDLVVQLMMQQDSSRLPVIKDRWGSFELSFYHHTDIYLMLYKKGPAEFVEELKKKGIRVAGIGHRIKSKDNRDKRVELLQNYAREVRIHLVGNTGCV